MRACASRRSETRELDLTDGARARDAWPPLGLGDEPAGLLYALNKRYAAPDDALADGDKVALIPPVSGGAFASSTDRSTLRQRPLGVSSEEAGAVATFTGTVRRRSRGREVLYLEYEAYAGMAEAVMEEIAAEVSPLATS